MSYHITVFEFEKFTDSDIEEWRKQEADADVSVSMSIRVELEVTAFDLGMGSAVTGI